MNMQFNFLTGRRNKRGFAVALVFLGVTFAPGLSLAQDLNDRAAIMKTLEKARAGDPEAQCDIGEYDRRVGGPSTNGLWNARWLEVNWFKRAADQKSARGLFLLGDAYSDGYGIAADEEKALECFRAAADQNYPRALLALADSYAHGVGEPRNNEDRPMNLLARAAKAEPSDAAPYDHLVSRAQYGPPGDRDVVEAVRWYCRGAVNHAVYWTGMGAYTLRDKIQIVPDKNKAVAFSSGAILPNGGEASELFSETMSLVLKAIQSGDNKKLGIIGEVYLTGRGGTINPAKAWCWFTLAAESNDGFGLEKARQIGKQLSPAELEQAKKELAELKVEFKAIADVLR